MLKLWNKERIKTASEVLQECIKGSLAKARVLYAPVEETGGEDRLLHKKIKSGERVLPAITASSSIAASKVV
ncbi:hypothetical protein JHK85_038968 [Glycine max]|nr:hypothetical protein JHK85_038968 [Glycine max]